MGKIRKYALWIGIALNVIGMICYIQINQSIGIGLIWIGILSGVAGVMFKIIYIIRGEK
jgi:hypothetical protein